MENTEIFEFVEKELGLFLNHLDNHGMGFAWMTWDCEIQWKYVDKTKPAIVKAIMHEIHKVAFDMGEQSYKMKVQDVLGVLK